MTKTKTSNATLIYTRVSTGEQSTSLRDQEERLLAYCASKNLEAVEIIRDENVSGGLALDDRPSGAKVAALIKSGRIKHIAVLKLDRLFRDCADCLEKTREWDKQGIALHLLDISVDTSTPMGRAFLTMAGAFAELERNLIRERTKNGLRHRKTHGKVFNHVPYGFNRVGDDLVPNAEEQRTVARIKRLRAKKETFRAIADTLNRAHIPSKTGKEWSAGAIHSVLATGLHDDK